MIASVIAKNTAQRAPGILQVNAICIDVLMLSQLCDQILYSFFIALLLPSGLGGSPIEVLIGFSKTGSKTLGKKK